MQPSIIDNQKVLVSSIPYLFFSPKKDDIVAFKNKDKIFIKRISKIKEDKYSLAGDNKDDSLDSRKFGEIPRDKILAKIIWY